MKNRPAERRKGAGPRDAALPAAKVAAFLDCVAQTQEALIKEYQAHLDDARSALGDLRLQMERFRATLDKIPQGVCFFDGRHRLVLSNRRFAEITGVTADDLKPGTDFRDVVRRRYAVGHHPLMPIDEFLRQRETASLEPNPSVSIYKQSNGSIIKIVHEPMPDRGWVATFEDITERMGSEERIRHLALHDALTDRLNRVGFTDALAQHGAAARAAGARLALIMLDIDHFKEVNDTLGHAVGDALLKDAVLRIRACLGEADVVGRIGSDEFGILLPRAAGGAEPMTVARAIVAAFARPFYPAGHEVVVTISLATADLADLDPHAEPARLMHNAEMALRLAKAEGVNAIRAFEPSMDLRRQAAKRLEQDMRPALANGEFTVHFQPKVDARTHMLVGVEALARWNHPELGAVGPATFIPVAEKSGLILDLGAFVLRQACETAAAWLELTLAVNLSPVQLLQNGLAERIAQILAETGFDPSRLELEITEGVLMQKTPLTMATLAKLQARGIKISIDDFGTGYSSLSYLQTYPVDRLKIDRSFIRNTTELPQAGAIIQATITMGHALGLAVTAEGIETQAQADLLKAFGCDELQGYLFGAPMPLADLEAWISAERVRRRARALPVARY